MEAGNAKEQKSRNEKNEKRVESGGGKLPVTCHTISFRYYTNISCANTCNYPAFSQN